MTSADPARYVIRVQGLLDPRWSEWFEGMTVTPTEAGDTLIAGPVSDQATLHGLLARVRDLNLVLLSVCQQGREPGPRV